MLWPHLRKIQGCGGGAHACVCETQREIERERGVRYRENISRPILMKLFAEVI